MVTLSGGAAAGAVFVSGVCAGNETQAINIIVTSQVFFTWTSATRLGGVYHVLKIRINHDESLRDDCARITTQPEVLQVITSGGARKRLLSRLAAQTRQPLFGMSVLVIGRLEQILIMTSNWTWLCNSVSRSLL